MIHTIEPDQLMVVARLLDILTERINTPPEERVFHFQDIELENDKIFLLDIFQDFTYGEHDRARLNCLRKRFLPELKKMELEHQQELIEASKIEY